MASGSTRDEDRNISPVPLTVAEAGRRGGAATAAKMTPADRVKRARKAAKKRHGHWTPQGSK